MFHLFALLGKYDHSGGGAQWSFIYIFVQELVKIFKNVIFYLSSGALNSGKWQRHNIEHATMRF